MAFIEVRARNTPSMYQHIAEHLRLEHEDHYQFSQDIPILDIDKGDVLICVQIDSVNVDLTKKPEEEIDPLITKALDETFIAFRIIKRSHKDADRFLNAKKVSKKIFCVQTFNIFRNRPHFPSKIAILPF